MALTNQEVFEKLNSHFGEAVVKAEEQYDALILEISKDKIHEVVAYAKQEPSLKMAYLTNIAGVHYPHDKDREICVVYLLHSLEYNVRLRLKTWLPISNPHIPTVTDIHASANWMERETYDFFGIIFDGHPDLRRILNDDSMDYFPMRKEYHLEEETRQDKDDRYFGR